MWMYYFIIGYFSSGLLYWIFFRRFIARAILGVLLVAAFVDVAMYGKANEVAVGSRR